MGLAVKYIAGAIVHQIFNPRTSETLYVPDKIMNHFIKNPTFDIINYAREQQFVYSSKTEQELLRENIQKEWKW